MIIFCFDGDESTESIFRKIISANKLESDEFHFNEIPDRIPSDNASSEYLFFIDTRIMIKKQNGFAFASEIRKRFQNCHIVFMSLHPEDMLLCFENLVRPSGFMLKPVVHQKVASFISAVKYYEKSIGRERTILISTREIKRNVHISEIVYFSTYGKKLYCRLSNGEHVEFYGSISKLEVEYHDEFLRCHSAFLVNRNYIRDFKKGDLELLNCSETIPVSRKYKKQILFSPNAV